MTDDLSRGQGAVTARKVRRLPQPGEVDPLYLKRLVDAALRGVHYAESRREYSLSTDIELMYNECIAVIRTLNLLMRASPGDAESVLAAVADLRVRLDDLRFHIRSSAPSLLRLQNHAALQSDEDH